MNPEYLEPDELLYELNIRKIFDLGNRRKQTGALSKMLSGEENGSMEFPRADTGLKCDKEIAVCMQKCLELRQDLKQSIESKDAGLMTRCITRTWHVSDRIKRIEPTDLYTENGLDVVTRDIEEIVIMVQKQCEEKQPAEQIQSADKALQISEIQKSIAHLTKSLEQIMNEPDTSCGNTRRESRISVTQPQLNATNPFCDPRSQGAIPKHGLPLPIRPIVPDTDYELFQADSQHGESLYNEDPPPVINTQSSPKVSNLSKVNFSRFSQDTQKNTVPQFNQRWERNVGGMNIVHQQPQVHHNQNQQVPHQPQPIHGKQQENLKQVPRQNYQRNDMIDPGRNLLVNNNNTELINVMK